MRKQIRMVGIDLLRTHRKRKQYSVAQVQDANRRQGVGPDFVCWPHSFFNSHSDFDALHRTLGEICDYGAMKMQLLESLTVTHETLWFDVNLSWPELPDIDLSIFELPDF